MPTGRIFLLRHGETEWSTDGRHTSHTDIPLTAHGRELAGASGRLLAAVREAAGSDKELVAVRSSPLSRAVDTATLAGLTPELDDRLREWDYGEYEGRTTPDIRHDDPEWTVWSRPSPGGETAADVSARADEVLTEYRGYLDSGDVVLIGHGHFSRVLTARWLGLPATAGVGFKLDPGGVTVLGDERGSPRLDHVNLIEPSES